ncbi:hypothetical protein PAMP_024867 [Pampus punctatissimus]
MAQPKPKRKTLLPSSEMMIHDRPTTILSSLKEKEQCCLMNVQLSTDSLFGTNIQEIIDQLETTQRRRSSWALTFAPSSLPLAHHSTALGKGPATRPPPALATPGLPSCSHLGKLSHGPIYSSLATSTLEVFAAVITAGLDGLDHFTARSPPLVKFFLWGACRPSSPIQHFMPQ